LKPAAQTAAPSKPLKQGDGPAYESMTREDIIASAGSAPRRKKLEGNKVSAKKLKDGIADSHIVDQDGKVSDLNSTHLELLNYAKTLGYKFSDGGNLPRSTKSVPADEWKPMLDYVLKGMAHFGFLKGSDAPNKPVARHVGQEPNPKVATTATATGEGEPAPVTSQGPESSVEAPVNKTPSGDWRSHDKSDMHPSQMSLEAGDLVDNLTAAGVPERDAVQGLNYYWDTHGLKGWDKDKIDQYTSELKNLLGVKDSAPEPEAKVEPEPEVKEPEAKVEPEPEAKVEPEAKASNQGTPEPMRQGAFAAIQDRLRDEYTPPIDGEHIQNFLRDVDVSPHLREKDQEVAFQKIVDAFSKYQGVDLAKKLKPEDEKKKGRTNEG